MIELFLSLFIIGCFIRESCCCGYLSGLCGNMSCSPQKGSTSAELSPFWKLEKINCELLLTLTSLNQFSYRFAFTIH